MFYIVFTMFDKIINFPLFSRLRPVYLFYSGERGDGS